MKKQNSIFLTINLCVFAFSCEGTGHAELVPYDNGKELWGFMDYSTHKKVIPPKYSLAYPFIHGHAIVGIVENGHFWFGLIDTLDNYVLEPEYDLIYIENGNIHVLKDGISRLLELGVSNGNSPVVSGQSEEAKDPGSDSVTVIWHGDKRVDVIDKSGKILFSELYGWAGQPSYKEGLMAFIKRDGSGKWGFIDTKGKQVIPYMYDFVDTFGFEGGFAVVIERGENPTMNKSAVINKKNELVLPFALDSAYTILKDSTICIFNKQTRKAKLLDHRLNEIIPYKYESITYIGEGNYKGETNGLFAVVDKSGRECLPARFTNISKFKNGMCIVRCAAGKEGFINPGAELAIPCRYEIEYDRGDLFGNGFVYTKDDSLAFLGKTRLLDINGREYIVKRLPARIIK